MHAAMFDLWQRYKKDSDWLSNLNNDDWLDSSSSSSSSFVFIGGWQPNLSLHYRYQLELSMNQDICLNRIEISMKTKQNK